MACCKDPLTPGPSVATATEGRMDFIALAPLGERVARIRRNRQPGGPGEEVSPIVNSYVGHHTSAWVCLFDPIENLVQ